MAAIEIWNIDLSFDAQLFGPEGRFALGSHKLNAPT
jgi:hypothetical protein